jgi:ATP-dependent protease HslVU (ClpYQ) ATPase subunit
MENMDKKSLQDNLSKALDILKQSNADELAKQINSVCSSDTPDKQRLEKLNINTEAVKNINPSDLEKLINYIDSHGDEIKSKLEDAIK